MKDLKIDVRRDIADKHLVNANLSAICLWIDPDSGVTETQTRIYAIGQEGDGLEKQFPELRRTMMDIYNAVTEVIRKTGGCYMALVSTRPENFGVDWTGMIYVSFCFQDTEIDDREALAQQLIEQLRSELSIS